MESWDAHNYEEEASDHPGPSSEQHPNHIGVDLTFEQVKTLTDWKNAQDAKVAARQGKDKPYYGSSGGGFTYCLTFTTLGTVIKVKNRLTQEEIDISDYENW